MKKRIILLVVFIASIVAAFCLGVFTSWRWSLAKDYSAVAANTVGHLATLSAYEKTHGNGEAQMRRLLTSQIQVSLVVLDSIEDAQRLDLLDVAKSPIISYWLFRGSKKSPFSRDALVQRARLAGVELDSAQEPP
jgi:hypothetical protein